jgi:hypothetical protein
MIVISNACDYRCVGGQSNSRKGRPFDLKPVYEFSGNMLGICSTPSVSKNQDFMTGSYTVNQHIGPF